jgi:hypothetical protein
MFYMLGESMDVMMLLRGTDVDAVSMLLRERERCVRFILREQRGTVIPRSSLRSDHHPLPQDQILEHSLIGKLSPAHLRE